MRKNARKTAKKYSYNVKYFNQPYSDLGAGVFIETNNPNPDSFIVQYYKSNGSEYEDVWFESSVDYFDLPLSSGAVDSGTFKVNGGYVQVHQICDPGVYTVKVKQLEKNRDNEYDPWSSPVVLEKTIGKITVKNYSKEYNAWVDDIINKSTTASMTPKEKMQAITDYLSSTTNYYKNYIAEDGEMEYLWLITEQGIPGFIQGEFDSFTSPAALEYFGDKIGYPVRSLYGVYEYGSPEWFEYHAFAESEEDGTLYIFCQMAETNEVPNVHKRSDVPKINCLTYDRYYNCY